MREPRITADSPVFQSASLPQVGQAQSPWPLLLGLGGAVLAGLVVFAMMDASRRERAPKPPPPAVGQPAPLSVAPYAPPPPPPVSVFQPPQPAPAAAAPPAPAPVATVVPADPMADRRRAPALVVDFSDAAAAPRATADPARPAGGDDKLSAEERFTAKVTSAAPDSARATRLRDLTRIAPQGTTIPAVLETAIDSDLPGAVRAVVSRDVRGFDGRMVLIPRGSKLIGQYRSGVAVGQTRAFVVWSRILTPEGVSIDVGSPGTDRLGRGGLEGETDDHFFRRFGAAILLSVLGAGLDAAANSDARGNTALIIGSPQQASRVAEIALQKQIDIAPTIRVKQGAPLQVFVSRDLDFSALGPARR